jgi:hypothetical protein
LLKAPLSLTQAVRDGKLMGAYALVEEPEAMYNRQLLIITFCMCTLTVCSVVLSKGDCAVRDYVKEYSWSTDQIPPRLPARVNRFRISGTANARPRPVRIRRTPIKKDLSLRTWRKAFGDMRHIKNKLERLQRTQNLSSQSLSLLDGSLRALQEELEFAETLIVGLLAVLLIATFPAYRSSMLAALISKLRNQREKGSVDEINPTAQWLADYAKRAADVDVSNTSREATSNAANDSCTEDNVHTSNEPRRAQETSTSLARECMAVSEGFFARRPDLTLSQPLEHAGESTPHFSGDVDIHEPREEKFGEDDSRHSQNQEDEAIGECAHIAPCQMRSINEILSSSNLTDTPAPSKPEWLESMSWELDEVDWDMQRLIAEWNIKLPRSNDHV